MSDSENETDHADLPKLIKAQELRAKRIESAIVNGKKKKFR